MFYFVFMIFCLFSFPQGRGEPRSSTRRYKPVIQVTEEIDINDITFTTSSPEFDRSSSHKSLNYYSGKGAEGIPKGGSYNRVPDATYPHGTSLPIVVPSIKYKPYKVYKVPDGREGFRPLPYKPQDKNRLLIFEPPTTFSAIGTQESPKQYSTKVIPYSSQYPSTKAPTKPSNYQENRNFIPSPTFSPTVLAKINSEKEKKFADIPDHHPYTSEKPVWEKSTKKPYLLKKPKKVSEPVQNHQGSSEDYSASLESSAPTQYKDSPQSESFLSEISTIHKGGSNNNNLDGVADSLDLKTGERVEFQMYGMDGPKSYKFGYDTGKGQNRHFRFEERDNTGKVKGHYGYLDEDGKMRIMKYEADPITGFHSSPVEVSADDN